MGGGIKTSNGTGVITADTTVISDISLSDVDVFRVHSLNSENTYEVWYTYIKATDNMIETNNAEGRDRTYVVAYTNPISFSETSVTFITTGSNQVGSPFEWEAYKFS